MKERKSRPIHLDLTTIHFPIPAIASILHRVAGVITFVSIGILLWLLSVSLSSPAGFVEASQFVNGFFVKFILWGIITALAYHLVGGIRHLIMDLGFCEELVAGRMTAKVSFIVTIVLSLLAGVWLW